MILFTQCRSCKVDIPIKSHASARPDLAMEKGDEFNITCTRCATIQTVHVNDVRAKVNKALIVGGIIISVVVTASLWVVLSAVGTISLLIPMLISKQQSDSVNTFNTYLTRR